MAAHATLHPVRTTLARGQEHTSSYQWLMTRNTSLPMAHDADLSPRSTPKRVLLFPRIPAGLKLTPAEQPKPKPRADSPNADELLQVELVQWWTTIHEAALRTDRLFMRGRPS